MPTDPASDLSDLGRQAVAASRAHELVRRIGARRDSSTFALVGEWGSGKTWLLNAILSAVKADAGWESVRCTIVPFNPWYYADEQALFTGFATLLVQKTLKTQRGRARVAKLLNTVGPSAKYGPVDLSGLATHAGESLGSTTPSQIRKSVEAGLVESGRQLLIVMDDLDRLNPDELLILFKLVRLVGDIPGLHYLLAYDEDTLHHLLKQTAIAAGSSERARRYLEKIVERRWEVPPLTEAQLESLLYSQLPLREGNPSDPGIGYRLESLVSRAVTTPRAAERYLDLAKAVPDALRDELHQGDLYLALFLRVAAPGLWSMIIEDREFLTGGGIHLLEDQRRARAAIVLDALTAEVADLPFGSDLLDLVVDSFPSFATALNPRNMRSAEAPRIGHRDFVDHYLWLDLPPGAVSEVEVATALRQLPSEAAEEKVRGRLSTAPRLLLDSVWRHATDEGVSKEQVIRMLEDLYRKDGGEVGIGTFTTIDRRIFTIANDLLKQMSPAELESLAGDEDGLGNRELLTELFARLHVRPEVAAEDLMTFADRMTQPLVAALATRLSGAPTPSFPESHVRRDYIHLFALDRDRGQTLVTTQLDAGLWRADDVLSMYIVKMSSTLGDRWQLNVQKMRTDLGEGLAARVEGDVSALDVPPDSIRVDIPTADQGRALAIYLLAHGNPPDDDDD